MNTEYVYKRMTPVEFAQWVKKRGMHPEEEICYGEFTAPWFDEERCSMTEDSNNIESWHFIKRFNIIDKLSDFLIFDKCGGGEARAMTYFDNDYFIEDFEDRINTYNGCWYLWVEMTLDEYKQTLKEV